MPGHLCKARASRSPQRNPCLAPRLPTHAQALIWDVSAVGGGNNANAAAGGGASDVSLDPILAYGAASEVRGVSGDWVFGAGVLVFACVGGGCMCVKEENETMCVCVCVCQRARKHRRECVCMCVC